MFLLRISQYVFIGVHGYMMHQFLEMMKETYGSLIIKEIGVQTDVTVQTTLNAICLSIGVLIVLTLFVA